ncbi:MAG: hypothetical protein HKN90_07140, partial [Flavobacteriaceae bacterium]|nr:hypothetical protein [Flavobacteriaceae bacterium]
IQEGTVIKAQKNRNTYIAVAQGGKLFVYGRENNPVTITSNAENPQPGDWGGILLFGKAPINSAAVDRSDLLDYFYGGDDTDDSSGFIRYLRVAYTGAAFNEDLSFNGLTLFGVGESTTFEYIQVLNSLGNGFRIVGGSVEPEKILSVNNELSGVVLSDGWQGSVNSWFIKNSNKASLEIINNKFDALAEPITSGTLIDISSIGPSSTTGILYTNGGGEVIMSNIYTSGLDVGIQIEGQTATMHVDAGDLQINPIEFNNTNSGFIKTNYTGPSNFFVEGDNLGAGIKSEIPAWASQWIIGF